jgi:hypothetical protein
MFLLWLLIATEIRYFYIYENRVEIYHPLYYHKWRTIYNQDILKIVYSGGGAIGKDGPGIFIIIKKIIFFLPAKNGFIVFNVEDRKKVLTHFHKLNIPIKIYSQAEEDQHLIEK